MVAPETMPFSVSPGSAAGPYEEAFRLPAERAAVSDARRRVRMWLNCQQVSEDARDMAQLVISELVTNAVVHTSSTSIACVLQSVRGQLRIEVRDQGGGTTRPTPRDAAAGDENGRGLLLVETLADTWGVVFGERGEGRTVWAALPAQSA
ncbi:ATP-binding protein [Streptomyces zagrosensis]|uniref:Anti-sigma regulatory factor (Ser/Thr protein kinase) n=1 Tax=Streptomyces zagrosensis TaxID=1042984 RepID=A0A7W9QEH7_9ACTN|nr:ATP-binding protein [Streptomyces zagrosensis]MBB5937752.1 anti-sigma regulatory factor (Ser/Thr protein kinase) [Streptomyces zagrosensis]